MSDKTYEPGDVVINLLDLVSLNGSKRVSMIGQVRGFDIYEGIMLPLIACEISIDDPVNLLEGFPIVGEEYVEIEFKNPELLTTTFFKFKVVKVFDKITEPGGKKLKYSLLCMSEEIIENSNKRIQKRYEGLNSYQIVKEILSKDIKTNKKYFVDDSPLRGNESLLVNNLHPLQAIDMVRKRTVSAKYKASGFNFFENRNGFNFVSINKLMISGKDAIGDKVFFYDTGVGNNAKNINVRNMIAYKQITLSNPIDMLQGGGVSNETKSIDIRTGAVESTPFNLIKNLGVFTQTGSRSTSKSKSPEFLNKTQSPDNISQNPVNSFLPKSSKQGDSFRDSNFGFLQSYVTQLVGNMVGVLVHGDAALSAGNVITLKFPEVSGTTDKKADSAYTSGNYLISRIRHMFVVGDRVKYKCAMECIRPSYGESE